MSDLMASVSLLNLSIMGAGLAAGDYFVVGDVSDTTQSAGGSDVRISVTNFFGTVPVPIAVTSASAVALAVGLAGATNPAFVVDASTATQAAGLKVTGAVAAGTVALAVISSGAAASLTINAKGTGTIGIGSVSTGAVTITPATTITGALTQTGLATFNGGATVAAGQTLTLTTVTVTGLTAASVGTGTFPGVYTITGAVTMSSTLGVTGAITGGGYSGGAISGTTGAFSSLVSVIRLTGDYAYVAWVTGDTDYRWTVSVDGLMTFGSGAGGVADTNLYRSAANTLKTDDTLIVAGALAVESIGAFAASDKYLVVDTSGNIHKSATGPAS